MIAVQQAAPISSNNTTATNSPRNSPITDTNIPALKAKAKHEITSVYQEIQQLENKTVRHLGYSSITTCAL